jgi:hypothetical protein
MQTEPAAQLLSEGVDRDRLEHLVRIAAHGLAFDFCYLVDEPGGTTWDGGQADIEPNDRRWRLQEVEADGTLTGRDVGGLHESLSETDPSGASGAGWF